MAEAQTLFLGILHVLLKNITLKKKKKRRTKWQAWKALKNLFPVEGERLGRKRERGDDLGANPTCQSAGDKGQVWGA